MGGTLGPALFSLQQQMQQPQPTAAPQTAIPTNDPFADSTLQTMQQGRQAFAQGEAQKAALVSQLQQIQAKQEALRTNPQSVVPNYRGTGYSPEFKGGSVKNVAGDIGKGLLLGLSATAPGRAVEGAYYGPGERAYGQQEQSLGQQSEELQKQLGSAAQGQTAAAGMATRPYGALARYEVGQMNNKTRQIHDTAWQKLQTSDQQLKRDVAAGKITQAQAHDKIEQQINAAHDQTLRDITNTTTDQRDRDAQIQAAEGEWRVNRENMLGGYVGSQLGINPTAPSQNPKAPPGPKAAGSRPNAKGKTAQGGTIYARDPQGKLHSAPAGTALPQGWTKQ